MTNFVGRLGVTLGLDSAEFSRGIDAASRKLEQFGQAAQKYGSIGVAALTAAGAAALRYADELSDAAKANDVAVASILQLSNALANNGGKADNVTKMLASFSAAIDKAAGGSFEAQKMLKGLGISLEDLRMGSVDELFRKTVAGLADMPDSLTRSARAADLFGKASKGVDLVGLNEDLSKNNQLTKEQGDKINAAGDAFDKLAQRARDTATVLASELGPPLKATLEYIDSLKGKTEGLGPIFKSVFQTVAVLGSDVAFIFEAIADEISHTAENAKLLAKLDFSGAKASNEAYWAKWEERRKKLDEFQNKVMGVGMSSPALDVLGEDLRQGGDKKPKRKGEAAIDKEAEAERKRLLENWAKGYLGVQQQIEEGNKLIAEQASEFQKKEEERLQKRIELADQGRRHEAEAIDEGNKLIAEQATAYQKANAAIIDRQRQEAISIERQKIMLELSDKGLFMKAREYQFTQEILQAQFKYQDELKRINDDESLSDKDKIAARIRLKELTEAEFDLAKQRLALADKYQNATFGEGFFASMVQSAQNATSAFQYGQQAFDSMVGSMNNALTQFVRTGKLSFKDLARSIISDLIAIQLRAQATALFSRLIGGMFTGSAVGPSMTAEALPAGFDQYLAARPKAEGGPVTGNSPYLVGERGPELFVPNRSGSIVPTNQLTSAMGGGQTINYNGPFIQTMSAIDTQSGVQFLAQNKQAVWAANQSAQRSLPVSR
jgi:lambda family phage tail tape measure protein